MLNPSFGEIGLESIPAGSGIPWHRHADQQEIISIHKGRLKVYYCNRDEEWNADDPSAIVDGGVLGPMDSVHIPPGVWHHFINITDEHEKSSDGEVWLQYILLAGNADSASSECKSLLDQISQ
jgi:uncharacterized RmlC-like cupin family protein